MCERGAERPELQLAELKGLRLWQGCGRGDTWLMIHQGALEAQGNSSRERHLFAQHAGGRGRVRVAGRGFGREGPETCYSACLFSSLVVSLKKPLEILPKGLYGHLLESNSIFFKIVFSLLFKDNSYVTPGWGCGAWNSHLTVACMNIAP